MKNILLLISVYMNIDAGGEQNYGKALK